jgi:pimeloyl-ACP methyl ester carboxylesterase
MADGTAFVTSKDGTKIAYDKLGSGPAVILVTGATGTRAGWGQKPALEDLLAEHFTVVNYDRRDRGDSTDTLPYAVAREIEDIEALIDAVGGKAAVYGISSGACLAMEAAAQLGDKVTALAMYEAPYDEEPGAAGKWHDYRTKLDELIPAHKNGDAIELFMRFVGAPAEMVEGMKHSPAWAGLEAVAPTLRYDADCMGPDRAVPTATAAKVQAQALIMDGGASQQFMPFMRASADKLAGAMPRATRQTIDGQGHDVNPQALAPALIKFFSQAKGQA